MAIAAVSSAFTSTHYVSSGSSKTRSYANAYNAGVTIVIAYGGVTGTAKLNEVYDSAGNQFTIYMNDGIASVQGPVALAYCRLQDPVTTSTVITFNFSSSHQCSVMGYAFTGASGVRMAAGQRDSSALNPATATVTPTEAGGAVFAAINYFQSFNFASVPTGSNGTPLLWLDSKDTAVTGMSLGLVWKNQTTTASQAVGLDYASGLNHVSAGIALPVLEGGSGGQVIAMF